ncbi:protein adenylyltransferase SelO family protein [Sphingomonas flavalba]|uniref:protein adenylyltransferase SelO family protein n=1 Tax=Sphingomonas flavalba TaxID=2559804 RepID=UPI00109DD2BC|nr:YdiU family protein [Sphingomonas flavalba]
MVPPPQACRPDTPITALGALIAVPVAAAAFPETVLRYRNDRAAAEVGLDGLDDAAWTAHFGRFAPLPGNLPQPLALKYHGHQFRIYNPQLGDGRGFLFAQLRDRAGRLMDLGTKGSGQTPYSRFGDGRLTLKGAVREILAAEMLEALGVHTSRALSVIETGEQLTRNDEPSPTRSAVLVRLSHGHIRIGSFQRLAHGGDTDGLSRLAAYALEQYYGEEAGDDAPARLLGHVAAGAARLAASYIAAGFVHGVLNSDNINITAESFDYGPWRFAPHFDPQFTAAYFDHAGLYAFGRQPEAIQWDVVQLAIALSPVADRDALVAALERFPAAYDAALAERMLWRLGVVQQGAAADGALVLALEQALIDSGVPIDRFFFDWSGGTLRDRERAPAYAGDAFADFRALIACYRPARGHTHPYWRGEPCSMLIDEVEALWAPIAKADDWTAFYAKIAAVRAMGEALTGAAK